MLREKFVYKLELEPQISGFRHRRLNQLVHSDTYTRRIQKQISLSLSFIFESKNQNAPVVVYDGCSSVVFVNWLRLK